MEKIPQLRVNTTSRQTKLLKQAVDKGVVKNQSEALRRALDLYLDRLIATHKLKEIE